MTTPSIKEAQLERAIVAYNEVWNGWSELDASNVDECRKAAMTAALATLSQPAADRLEVVARIIRPEAWKIPPSAYGLTTDAELEAKTIVGGVRRHAREKATKIIAALDGGR